MNSKPDALQEDGSRSSQGYQVVARRYRPQNFESLVGQSRVATALANAIKTDRVGHAYLFTGARGVGKTSSARIFAKCLNCEQGPTDQPCGVCDVCVAVNEGNDIDVLEIDGASNRGIEEIRELRANINVRPSRSQYKIYIIDEVHMLTAPAFNALLKTLEEPPSHVKFIFCTTDPEKIPITVLSRCQRFDFGHVEPDSISQRLQEICQQEGFEAEPEALALLAKRANGSMRDSQSLLEQLLSFCDQKITLDDVNRLLGTADLASVKSIIAPIVERNSQQALSALESAIREGVEIGQLGNQLVGFFRDMLVVINGCGKETLLTANPSDFDWVKEQANRLGNETILACLQIFDNCLTKLRYSSHTRTLAEMAIIRACNLENLDAISTLLKQAKSGLALTVEGTAARPTSSQAAADPSTSPEPSTGDSNIGAKKKEVDRPGLERTSASTSPDSAGSAPDSKVANDRTAQASKKIEINNANIETFWREMLQNVEDISSDYASHYESLAISAPNCLAVTLDSFYKEKCEIPSIKSKLEAALQEITQQQIRIDFVAAQAQPVAERKPAVSKRQQMKELEQHPLVRGAIDTFDGEIVDVRKLKK